MGFSSSVWKKVAFSILFSISFFVAAFTFFLFSDTLVSPLMIIAPLAAVALATAYPVGRNIASFSGFTSVWTNAIIYVFIFVLFSSFAILALNFSLADSNNLPYMNAVADRVYWKKRNKTIRTGRRTYSTGAPYKVYFIDLRLPDGKQKRIEVKYSVFKNVSRGDTVKIRIGKGALSLPIIDPASLSVKGKPTKKRHYPPYRIKRHKSLTDSSQSRKSAFY